MSSKIDVNKIAQLAHLKLSDAESERIGNHLKQVIDYIDQLNELDTSNIEPTSHVLPINNIFREDETSKLNDTDYLIGAPAHNKGHYEVPKII